MWRAVLTTGLVLLGGAAVRADDAAARSVAALGGEEAWAALESLDVACRHTSFGSISPCRLRRARPNLYRLDYSEGPTPRTDAFDGRGGWWQTTFPFISRATWPVPVPTIYQGFFRRQAEFEWPMIGVAEKGHRIRSLGEVDYEGETFLGLDVTRADGHEERWFLDPETYLPVLKVDDGVYHGYPVEIRTHFSDYREVAGVRLPFEVSYEQGNDFRVIEIDAVEVNSAIDAEVFRRPIPAGMEALRPLAGRWRVTIGNRDDPAFSTEQERLWEEHVTTSTIESRHDGSLLAERMEVTTPRPRQLERLYSFDRFRGVYRIVAFDGLANLLDVLEGPADDEGRIVVTNLGTGTTVRLHDEEIHVRETIHDVGPDGFKIRRELSRDGGATWWTDLRLTYEKE